jgi:fucose 4-O-acetylase-like acetyltransferase
MEKRQDIEALRVISVFGIVWFHSNASGHDIAYSGLVAFLILSMYLAGSVPVSIIESIAKRFARLIIPWMIWFVIYGAVNSLKGKPPVDSSNGLAAGILAGTSLHLWYLPYIFFALVLFDALRRYVSERHIAIGSAILVICAFASVPYWRQASIASGYPYAQYAHALPGLFLGVFFLYYRKLPSTTSKSLLIIILLLAYLRIPYEDIGIPYALGICAGYAIVNRSAASKTPRFIGALGKYSFGIYLIHILFLRLIGRFDFIHGSLVPVFAFLLSLATIAAISKNFPRAAKYVC